MWLISGTIPEEDFPLNYGSVWEDSRVEGDRLVLPGGKAIPIARGTAALSAAAILACGALGAPAPRLLLVGDTGKGDGSRAAYKWLAENLGEVLRKMPDLKGLTFHYFYPDSDWHNRVLMAVDELDPRPIVVADAGFMYVAKMSGYARSYDLFTPDLGELAFLADEKAPHPFYTRGFLLAEDKDMPLLFKRALEHSNCPPNMIVKGKADYIICDDKLVATVSEPSEAAMECIGGTGDVVTGLATAWLASGAPICRSALCAARAARLLAAECHPIPATQVAELIAEIPATIKKWREEIEKD